MKWTKNLSKLRLPRSGQVSNSRGWQTLEDRANRDMSPRDEVANYAKALSDVRLSSVVMTCVGWITTMLPRCGWTLEKEGRGGMWKPMEKHPILDLLANPTPQHGGPEMLSAILCDYLIAGTGYWQRVAPDQTGPPKELWWRPEETITPRLSDDRKGLAGFNYKVDGEVIEWQQNDVVQVRNAVHGQNPANPWLGVSPLRPLAPQVWIDQEATKMTAALLKNLGQIGVTVSLKQEALASVKEGDAALLKKYLREGYSGSRRGDALFIEFPADIHGGGLVDPNLMHPKALRDYVEEMCAAIYHLPPAVVGFGVGLEAASQNATMVQLEKQAWETGVLPVMVTFAAQTGRQLLPAFNLDHRKYRLGFDTSGIEVLQKSRKEEAEMWTGLVNSGIVLRSQALEALGLPFDPSDEVRHMPISVIEVPAGVSQLEAEGQRQPEPDDDDDEPDDDDDEPDDDDDDDS